MKQNIYGRFTINNYNIGNINDLIILNEQLSKPVFDQLNYLNQYLNKYGVFYGGSIVIDNSYGGVYRQTLYNTVNVLNFRGDRINLDKTAGTARSGMSGGGIGGVGVYYGGSNRTGTYMYTGTSIITRLNAYGYMIGTETNAGLNSWSELSSAVINNTMMVFGGSPNLGYGFYNNVQTFNDQGVLLNDIHPAGVAARSSTGGVGFVDNNVAMYYGGANNFNLNYNLPIVYLNNCIRFDQNSIKIGDETNIGTTAYEKAGCLLEDIAVYFGGTNLSQGPSLNILTRISVDGSLVGSETNVGSARNSASAAGFGDVGVYFMGENSKAQYANGYYTEGSPIITRFNSYGVMLGQEFNITPGRDNTGVATVSL